MADNRPTSGLLGESGQQRCWWCVGDADYEAYHHSEWGRASRDDRAIFEKLCLEGFQAGLSWLTILRKRENFRQAFAQFDHVKVAKFGSAKVEKLLQNAGIVRHRRKIESAINNAKRAKELIAEFGSLADYVWQYAPSESPVYHTPDDFPTQTPESVSLSKDLKKRGWTFLGPTTCYAFMQSLGLVIDHLPGCHVFDACQKQRSALLQDAQAIAKNS